MREYIITLVGTCFICGVAELLVPESEGGGTKKQVKFISSLCVLCALISPILILFNSLSEYDMGGIASVMKGDEYKDKYEEICNESIAEYGTDELERICSELICKELGVKLDSFDVDVYTEVFDDSFEVRRAIVTIYPEAIVHDPREISVLVGKTLRCECEIIYSKKDEK